MRRFKDKLSPSVKDNLSRANTPVWRFNGAMDWTTEDAYERALAKRLREVREQRNMSIPAFAKSIGLDGPRYAKMEQRRPPAFVIARVCAVYSVPAHFFLIGAFDGYSPLFSPRANRPLRGLG